MERLPPTARPGRGRARQNNNNTTVEGNTTAPTRLTFAPRRVPNDRQNNNNAVEGATAARNEPTRLYVPRRVPNVSRAAPPRPPVRRPTPPVRHVAFNDSSDDDVIDLVTPPRPVVRPQQQPNVQAEPNDDLFRDLDFDWSSDDDEGFDENVFHSHVIEDEDSGDMNNIFNTLQAEEHAETEQERLDREYARRLQMEENLYSSLQRRIVQGAHAGAMPIPIHRHFGEPRDEQVAQRAQQQELQEQTIALARRRIEHLLMARMPIERQRVLLGAGNPGAAPRSLMGLHFVDRDFDERDYEMLLQLDDNVPNRNNADAKMVEKIPVKTVKAGDKFDRCSVCLCDMEEGDIRRELPCDHGFHKDCIDKWLKDYKETCPICKQSLSEMEAKTKLEKKKKRKVIELESSSKRQAKKRKISEKNE